MLQDFVAYLTEKKYLYTEFKDDFEANHFETCKNPDFIRREPRIRSWALCIEGRLRP